MMLLVTGASGVGKSTVRRLIAEELEPEVHAVELTQIAGPPTGERGWRQRAVEEVVQVALAEQQAGRHLLLVGDPVPPGEVLAAPSRPRCGSAPPRSNRASAPAPSGSSTASAEALLSPGRGGAPR